jgi:EAL domain-containing protein (putative c-di-GMP-specific phosphodiesterase class I)
MLGPPLLIDAPSTRLLITPPGLARHARGELAQRRRLQRDLASAAGSGGFVLHYQPRINLESGLRSGAAARISWLRRHGLVSAGSFRPLAESAGLTAEIGGWMLKTACVEAAASAGGAVSVPVCAQQLANHVLTEQVARALELSALSPERLELAFTEMVLDGAETDTLLLLSALRDLGTGIAVDEFGAAVGSLALLKRLPLSSMKLARTLLREVADSGEEAAFARAVIDAGRALGITIVADGIETSRQCSLLARMGCEEGQGPLFGQRLSTAALRDAM